LLILLSGHYEVKEDKSTASAVSDTNDSAQCIWLGIGRVRFFSSFSVVATDSNWLMVSLETTGH
jgi:hypothetical protein